MAAKTRPSPIVLAPERLLEGMPGSGVLDPEGVHQLRRVTKRARAILRLAEDAGRPGVRTVRRALTRAARPFAPLRDATVVAALAGRIAAKQKGRVAEVALTIAEATPPVHEPAWWTRQWQQFARVGADLGRVDDTPLSPPEVAAALEQSVRRVCRCGARARPRGGFKRAHAWRKAVKLLRTQLHAAPVASRSLAKLSDRLKKIARWLGDAADHEALMAAVAAQAWPRGMRKPARKLVAASRKKQRQLVRRACTCWAKVEPELRVLRKP